MGENRLNLKHYTPGEQNKEGGVRKWKSQSTKQREVNAQPYEMFIILVKKKYIAAFRILVLFFEPHFVFTTFWHLCWDNCAQFSMCHEVFY